MYLHANTHMSTSPEEKATITVVFHPWENTAEQGFIKRVLKQLVL